MPFCSNCGNKNPVGARFCSKCGKEQVALKPNCPNCGKILETNVKFCPDCGTSITAGPINNEANTVKPECIKKAGKFTKEGRKIIDAGPKPNQTRTRKTVPPTKPPSAPKKKKRSFLGCLGKSLLILFALIVVGVIIILILPDSDKENKLTNTNIPGIVDIKPKKESNSNETHINTNEKKNKKTILDANDENSADKYRYGIDIENDQYKAVELYEKLAVKGDLNAMVELSDYYEQGIWVKKDLGKSKELLKKAADAGSLAAKWQLEFLESKK